MKRILQKLVDRIGLIHGFKYQGYIDYPGIGKIYDHEVWQLIKDHSRFVDRLSTKRMTEMSLLGQCILMKIFDDVDPNDPSWTFYGKNALHDKRRG